ncbi:hypothetical protein [Pseudomonas sp. NPDC087336]|uniref:hypothetical protein n=1 Tax=Pseudomonas sp. NPDC087336 TaxID=3364436 RepID=UPI0038115835
MTNKKSTSYIIAKQGGTEIFRTTNVGVENRGSDIVIRGHDTQEKQGFGIEINIDTPSGEQQFQVGGVLRVIYRHEWNDLYATRGTYNAYIEKGSRHVKLTFKLEFGNLDEIEGDVEVTILHH